MSAVAWIWTSAAWPTLTYDLERLGEPLRRARHWQWRGCSGWGCLRRRHQEIVALTTTQVLVFTAITTGVTQKASYAVTGTDLLVADTNGDGKAEIYVLASAFGSSNASVYQFDGSLTLQNSYPLASVGSGVTSLYFEASAFPRKNIVVALGTNSYSYNVAPTLEVIDPTSGAQIWQSPPLRGYVPPNSLNFYDLTGSGRLQMVFGTSVGMYVTQ